MLSDTDREGIIATQLMVMPHRCTIQRNSAQGEDPYGGPTAPDWYDVTSDEPCRLITQERVVYGLQQDERVESLVLSGYLLLLRPDLDVRERDRVLIGDEVYTISSVSSEQQWRAGLRHVQLEKVS